MNAEILSKLSEALEALKNGKTVEFSWCGECVRATLDDARSILDGIRYIIGGGEWKILEGGASYGPL